jgi:hypothetical protein
LWGRCFLKLAPNGIGVGIAPQFETNNNLILNTMTETNTNQTDESGRNINPMLADVYCRLTKSAISKIVNWSTSRYNTAKKSEIVKEIYDGMLNGGIWRIGWKEGYSLKWKTRDIEPLMGDPRIEYLVTEIEYSSGSYCECSSMSRTGTYQVNFENKTIIAVEDDKIFNFNCR